MKIMEGSHSSRSVDREGSPLSHLRACHCCGLAHQIPSDLGQLRARCSRCGSSLSRRHSRRSKSRTAAAATAALILYPFAVALPLLEVEQFGHRNEASIIEGVMTLLTSGQWFVGAIVFLCSVLLPLGKLGALFILSRDQVALRAHHRAWTYRFVEWTGRFGMLDVLLVAILVAVMKLGSVVTIRPGPAAVAFTCCVLLSLLASSLFDPHSLWEDEDR